MMDNCNDPEARSVLKQVMDLKHEFSVMNTTKKIPDYVIDDKLTFNIEQIGYDGTARVYCLTGDNKITLDGKVITVKEACGRTGYIESVKGPSYMSYCGMSGVDDIYEVELCDGKKVRCNRDHPFAVLRDEKVVWVKAKDLTEQDNVVINN